MEPPGSTQTGPSPHLSTPTGSRQRAGQPIILALIYVNGSSYKTSQLSPREDAMYLRISGLLAIVALALAGVLGSPQSLAQNAYIPSADFDHVSVIDTVTNTVIATIPVGMFPMGVAVSPDGRKVYVTNETSNNVSVISTFTNRVIGSAIPVGTHPVGVAVSPDGRKVYVTNTSTSSYNVSVIDTAKNRVTATIPVGQLPLGVAVTPDGVHHSPPHLRADRRGEEPGRAGDATNKVYVANAGSNNVSVVDAATNKVIATIPVGLQPIGVAVSPVQRKREDERERGDGGGREREPEGGKVYVVNELSNSVSVIDAATNTVIATIPVGTQPAGVAVSPDGSRVYVTNANSPDFSQPGTVSVIDAATNTVIATIPVGTTPGGVSVTPDGSRVYVANAFSPVSVIDAVKNIVVATITVANGNGGGDAFALGLFIQPKQPALEFAGTPGEKNYLDESVSALAKQYGGLNNAAAALGFDSVGAVQYAIEEFCAG
jgi:YVTN family beta-propeller protein